VITATKLDRISTLFFVIGGFFSQTKLIPLGPYNAVLYSISMFFNFTAYFIWLISSRLYPDEPKLNRWYGFAKYKNQHLSAALFGILSLIAGGLSFAFPFMLIPAAWLFVFSDLVWFIGEYHKFQNPNTRDKDCNGKQQNAYLTYVALMTMIATVIAIATMLTVFIPTFTALIAFFSTITCLTLGLFAIEKLFYFSMSKTELSTKNSKLNIIAIEPDPESIEMVEHYPHPLYNQQPAHTSDDDLQYPTFNQLTRVQ